MLDQEQLVNGENLTANHISACQRLLKQAYPNQHGLQDPCKLSLKHWHDGPVSFVQVVFADPNHWVCISNKFSKRSNTVDLYDSMHTAPDEDSSLVKQVCVILRAQESSVYYSLYIGKTLKSAPLGSESHGLTKKKPGKGQ